MSEKTAREEMREQIALWGQGSHPTRPASAALADIIERYVDARIAEVMADKDLAIVPREPTDAMIDAGVDAREALFEKMRREGKDTSNLLVADHPAGTIYAAMVSAAPSP